MTIVLFLHLQLGIGKLATALSKDGSMIWDDVRRTALCSEQRVVAKRTVVLRAGF
ncbi:MAG: hypothetical protein H7A28_03435 [Thermotogae bacterium]|uniref:hypothetical protein n=1 Tax=Mesotoga prima TaxID=1184387 RepID=UPI001BD38CA9|nr:hypothetical protein [Mesotoga prima]MCP5460753.1 hypothetical protein [Thermotogota bacterium]